MIEEHQEYLARISSRDAVVDALFNEWRGSEPIPAFASRIKAAITRMRLRADGKETCPRCKTKPASGTSGAPDLCHYCFSDIVAMQEEAYGLGWSAFCEGKPKEENPYNSQEEGDENTKYTHWLCGWEESKNEVSR